MTSSGRNQTIGCSSFNWALIKSFGRSIGQTEALGGRSFGISRFSKLLLRSFTTWTEPQNLGHWGLMVKFTVINSEACMNEHLIVGAYIVNIYVVCCDDAKKCEPPFQSPCTDLITSMMSPFFSLNKNKTETIFKRKKIKKRFFFFRKLLKWSRFC